MNPQLQDIEMTEPFCMKILDVFHFQDGNIVLAGEVKEGPATVSCGSYEVSTNGERIGSLTISGERSAGRRANIRSFDVSHALGVNCDSLKGQEVDFGVLERV